MSFERLYPEVARAGGSFPEAFDEVIRQLGSPVSVSDFKGGGLPTHYARVEKEQRFCQIYMAAEERLFLPDYWDNGVCLAQGKSENFEAIVQSVSDWVSMGVCRITELSKRFPFIELNHGAEAHEGGTATELRWSDYLQEDTLADRHPDLPILVYAVSKHPKLRQLFPYLSMDTFHLSRCTGYPYTSDTPWFEPLGDGRFRVSTGKEHGSKQIAEGTAAEVAKIAAALIPDDLEPAWIGIADDEKLRSKKPSEH